MTNIQDPSNPMLETKTRTRTKTKVAMIVFFIAAAAIGLSAGAIRGFKFKPFDIEGLKKGADVVQPTSVGPDLIITNFTKNTTTNSITYNITFKNIGNAPATVPPLFSVTVYRKRVSADEAYNAQSSATPLFESAEWKFVSGGAWSNTVNPNEQATVSYLSTVLPPADSNKARAVVDSKNEISETNETNNISSEINL